MYGQPVYGMQPIQPMYGGAGFVQPPPAPVNTGPTIINIGGNDSDNGPKCPNCQKHAGQIPKKKIGCTAILWCICLLPTGFLWCLPCCMDGCKDTELICTACQTVKNTIPANCC